MAPTHTDPVPVSDLLAAEVGSIKLKILVFGPQVARPSSDTRTQHYQNKRIEIKTHLQGDGHIVHYAEDLVDPTCGNLIMQEMVIMTEYDMIVNLVDSPGSITEASIISIKPKLAQKTSLYMDSAHSAGLVADSCRLAERFGAYFEMFGYPTDLVDCHLLTSVRQRVQDFQAMKYLL